ncbi:hypothetical protein [Alishewanella tabrizica]|uniref:Lipoprotein n=1 Tax=Alishewanella tabrizica TaxID=671278 RepID=A0ABQ2WCF5_9ALTE|nr:hypothetical protein [Alishewanella tabrizica]GGW48544.1 hypothetical protein GCM10008111_00230 [Alishewanella tabrizica]
MLKTRLLAALVAGSALSACGGGDSGNSGTGGGGSGGGIITPTTFTAKFMSASACGTTQASTNGELVIHDQNWRVISRHRPDSNGNVSANFSGGNVANISTITYSTGQNAEFSVTSYAQHPVTDLGSFYVPGTSQQGCDCQNVNVVVSSAFGSLSTADVQLTGFTTSEQRRSQLSFNEVQFEQVGVCRVPNGAWPLLTAVANNGTARAIAGSVRQYNIANPVNLTLNQNATVLPVSLNTFDVSLSETHYTTTGGFGFRSRFGTNDVFIFNQLEGVEVISLRAATNQVESTDGGFIFRSATQRQNFTVPLNNMPVFNVPNTDAQQALESFLVRDLPSNNNNYNLSSVQGFNTFYLYAQTRLTDGTNYFQSFIGPLQGTYPDEIVPADYNIDSRLDENASATINASVIRYGDNQTYRQYLLDLSERGDLPFAARLTGKWANYSTVSVQITTTP